MTKSRFIQFQKQNEGYNTDSASDSFHRRLDEASTDNADSDEGKPQVYVRGNTAMELRRGVVTSEQVSRPISQYIPRFS